ncbi:molybdopterin molybdotransferase MoeA [Rugamonas apoptosis]|uniref:molybdopterin molybdotransferase MoeA n=1 Tax=Rugamonas apoptosis TaxID=2758570 RepID=UPI002882FA1D|nr:gephyrin-like molybdotransferase Glp [Rugamonas apoptosis]
MNSKVSGLILAGGRGTRMGRVDKGLQPFRGSTLAAHVLQRLAPQVASVAINANRNLPQYEEYGCPVLSDELTGFEGPLAGLQTGLRHCATELLLTAPCDSPFLPPDLAQRLASALQSQDAEVAVAVTLEADEQGVVQRQLHPVFALLRAGLLPQLDAYLATGARRMEGWYKSLRLAEVVFEDAAAFRNINTLGELQQLEAANGQADQPLTLAAVASCLDAYDPDAMSVRDAQRIIGDFITPIQSAEKVALRSALDRVLAQDVISPINVPAYDNSAMDGYALRGADLPQEGNVTLDVIGIVYAGRPTALACGAGQCVRIMTGGAMPEGCDTVLPQELAAAIGDGTVTIAAGVLRAGDNRRFKGEDLAEGGVAIARGKLVRPADLGLIASLGLAEVAVQRRLRVAFFSTGDELRSVGETLDTGCVYDSNRYTLFGMLQRLGCDVIDMGIVKDDTVALEAALRSGCENADAIITSGGVSDGAADYTRAMMARLGDVAFWKLNMRPGRPLAFGKILSNGRSAWLFGLPGNPVAVMVSFYFFARAALLHMMGANAPLPLLRARAQSGIRKRPGRSEFQRGVLSTGADGQPQVRLTGAQGSGILRSMSEANCMVVLRDDQGNVAEGDMVDVLPFEGLL